MRQFAGQLVRLTFRSQFGRFPSRNVTGRLLETSFGDFRLEDSVVETPQGSIPVRPFSVPLGVEVTALES